MSPLENILGWIVTNIWIGTAGMVLAAGLWLQGWLAGRKYYNRARSDPWGTLSGMLWLGLHRSATGEDRMTEIGRDTTLGFVRPNGEVIDGLTVGRLIDGQSIPTLARLLVGGPFDGRSRDMGGVHDELCAVNDPARIDATTPPMENRRTAIECHGIAYEITRSRGMWWRGPIFHAILLNWGTKWKDPS